ncbi:MAG: hypothetical protein GY827_12480 [Cytophagales bacterium]|nr:hypothetical protein [Cytophagales bacterium]
MMIQKKLFIIFISFFSVFSSWGQEKEDSVHIVENGIRLNIELIRPILTFAQENYTAYDFSVDVGIKPKLLLEVEGGYHSRLEQETSFDYSVSGTYFRVGVLHNFLDIETAKRNLFFGGISYGLAIAEHQVDNAIIYDQYWGNVNNFDAIESFSAHWGELSVGMKTPVVGNLFLGFTLKGKLLLYNTNTLSERPYIPGFGLPNNSSLKTGISFHYYLSYRFPFKKGLVHHHDEHDHKH